MPVTAIRQLHGSQSLEGHPARLLHGKASLIGIQERGSWIIIAHALITKGPKAGIITDLTIDFLAVLFKLRLGVQAILYPSIIAHAYLIYCKHQATTSQSV
jgi:hypothetical protein